MKYGIDLPNMGAASDPKLLATIAREAEDAGWDGVFIFDSLYINTWGSSAPGPMADPWIALAAMAAATERVRLGPMITPLARRRPWKVARETVTLDHLSNGRVVLPVGLGTPEDGGFGHVGEELDRKTRAAKLDESLAILDGLWSGEPFAFAGEHYNLKEMTFLPKPVQSPRIPVWVVGAWPREKSMRRAVRWDGIVPVVMRGDDTPAPPEPAEIGRKIAEQGAHAGDITPEDVGEIAEYARPERDGAPFDIVIEGWSSGSQHEKAAARIGEYKAAGATWWVEAIWSYLYLPPHDADRMRERIRGGPPRAA